MAVINFTKGEIKTLTAGNMKSRFYCATGRVIYKVAGDTIGKNLAQGKSFYLDAGVSREVFAPLDSQIIQSEGDSEEDEQGTPTSLVYTISTPTNGIWDFNEMLAWLSGLNLPSCVPHSVKINKQNLDPITKLNLPTYCLLATNSDNSFDVSNYGYFWVVKTKGGQMQIEFNESYYGDTTYNRWNINVGADLDPPITSASWQKISTISQYSSRVN